MAIKWDVRLVQKTYRISFDEKSDVYKGSLKNFHNFGRQAGVAGRAGAPAGRQALRDQSLFTIFWPATLRDGTVRPSPVGDSRIAASFVAHVAPQGWGVNRAAPGALPIDKYTSLFINCDRRESLLLGTLGPYSLRRHDQ